jgi:asparagine synthase (glutamine-hydrolysing)
MCGICGVVYKTRDRIVDDKILDKMNETIAHRGPDGKGVFIRSNVGLGHRRLSIIDIQGGYQPMSNEDGSIWIVFNGEIYNYKELSKYLITKGHILHTSSDTETIIHLYEEYGFDCLSKLRGMFSFAIWDDNKRTLFIARDRLGIKPLYYYFDDNKLLFSSEIKSILRHDEVPLLINEKVIEEYFVFRYISGARTLYRGIHRVMPGECLIWHDGLLRKNIYWDIEVNLKTSMNTESEYIKDLDELLSETVRSHLVSDVPLGTFCSGGVDSSLVTAYASENSIERIRSFCIGFDEKEWDERYYASLVAEKYNTVHQEVVVRNAAFSNLLPKLIWHNDEPLSHPNSVQMYFLSEFARQFVKVILTGEGADETFGGYPRYNILRFYEVFAMLPSVFSRAVRFMLTHTSHRKSRKMAEGLSFPTVDEAIIFNSMFVNPLTVSQMLNPEIQGNGYGYRLKYMNQTRDSNDALQRLFLYEIKTYLVCLLERLDKMSMAVGLETRVPFLDHKMVEFVCNIPWRYKINKLRNKYLLKQLAFKKLPRAVISRPKSGLGVPLDDWSRSSEGLGTYLPLLEDSILTDTDYFNKEALKLMISKHQRGEEDNGELIWLLINFRLWLDIIKDYKKNRS